MSANEATESQQRRKLQNRSNQRARRLRLRGDGQNPRRPFKIERWRLNEEEPVSSNRSGLHPGPSVRHNNAQEERDLPLGALRGLPMSLQDLTLMEREPLLRLAQLYLAQKQSPLRDHLLHLIQFNCLRAIFNIKFVLAHSTAFCVAVHASGAEPQLLPIDDAHPTRATLVMTRQATASNLPSSLRPTHSQTTKDHTTWIDVLPFPTMRDNLINYEAEYDQVEFGHDLVGDLVDFAGVYGLERPAQPLRPTRKSPSPTNEIRRSETQTGLIVWGEPHCLESWEVTPGFMQKWPWALAGCQQLIDSSNRWRAVRGEDPLPAID